MNFVKKIAYAATLSAITLAPVVGSQVFAAPVAASAQQATSSLVKQLAGLQRLTADFEQSTKTTNNKTVQKKGLTAQHMNQTFSGVMKVARPGKFYWETLKPAKQTIATTGKVVWISAKQNGMKPQGFAIQLAGDKGVYYRTEAERILTGAKSLDRPSYTM